MTLDTYYANMWDARQRDPLQGDFGPAWSKDNPSGFRAYMTMTRYSPDHSVHRITDLHGRPRWLNSKGYRIMCAALLVIASDRQTSLTELADRIGCHRQTVSRWLRKLTAWGVLGCWTVRGRYGGIVLVARKIGDSLGWMADAARAKIEAIRARKLNAHPPTRRGREATDYTPTSYVSKGAHLRLEDVLPLDPTRKSGMIACPAHEDRQKSLSWKITSDDKLLVHCFAGCTFDEIRRAVGG